ncbi:hypothetical protein [Scytonema sp. NUACC26]|uniref:hypothetical protein n=1 Tax=Scytonema sp. NUACC26 TaxID=3140176 RepID=UPI0034DBBDC2
MSNRITHKYNQGNGDRGYSLLLDGHSISKDDPSCWIYSEIEHLNNQISQTLATYELEYCELLSLLEWLKSNSFSISSFCFLKGNSDRHALSVDISDDLEWNVCELKEDKVVGEAADFVIHNSLKYIALDTIRISIRDVERAFTKWRRHDIIMQFIIDTVREQPDIAQRIVINIDGYAGFLNRLSTYLWLATRQEALMCGDCNTQSYWNGGVVEK